LNDETTCLEDSDRFRDFYFFDFSSKAAASPAWPVIPRAYWNSVYVFKVGAVHTEPLMQVIWVDVFGSGFEFLAGHLGTVMERTGCDAFNISSVFKVLAILATLDVKSCHSKELLRQTYTLLASNDIRVSFSVKNPH
jgi:hypothetical protein